MGAGFAKSIKMSHFSAKTAKKTPFYCFSPRFKSRHLNHKKSDTGLEGRQGENISPQVGGIYRRQNNGYPLFSMRVRSRRKSRHLNHKKSKRYLVAYFFCIPTIFLLYFILPVKSASLLTVYRENPQTFVCGPSLMNLHCLI